MSTTTASETCAACKSWKQTAGNQGECRAHSPQLVAFEVDNETKIESKFPVTTDVDWCGDFQAK